MAIETQTRAAAPGSEPPHTQIERLTLAANKVRIEKIDGDAPNVRRVIIGDKVTALVLTPAPLKTIIETPADFVRWAKDHEAAKKAGVITFDPDALRYFEDADDRTRSAECPLTFTPPFAWLKEQSEAETSERMSQSDFVRLLRITFRNCIAPEFTELFRKLRFEQGQIVDGAIGHGKSSIDKSVKAAVTGGRELPTEVTFRIPIWEEVAWPKTIACAVEVFEATGEFALTPFPGEVRGALDAGMGDFASLLQADGLPPAYRGSVSS